MLFGALPRIGKKCRTLSFLIVALSVFACFLLGPDTIAIDVSTFEELSNAIAGGETDIVIVQDLEYSSLLTIGADVSITGSGQQLTRAADYVDGLFDIKAGADLSLENIVIDGGASGW